MTKTAGYSGTPLPKKLGIKEETRLAIVGEVPAGFDRTFGKLPAGVEVRRHTRGRADVIVCFVTSRAQLYRRFAGLERAPIPTAACGSPGPSGPRGCRPT